MPETVQYNFAKLLWLFEQYRGDGERFGRAGNKPD